MTISSIEDPVDGPYPGNDSQTEFPFYFKTVAKADVKGVRADPDGVETVLVLDSDFSISLNADQNANPGGTMTYPLDGGLDPLPEDWSITIESNVQFTQPADIVNAGSFHAQVHEDTFDRIVTLVKQVNATVRRALQLGVSTPAGVDVTLPTPVAFNVIGWNDDGTQLRNFGEADGVTVIVQADDLAEDLADTTEDGNGAGMVGFIQGLTGATARTVQSKLREVKSFEDFMPAGLNPAALTTAQYNTAVVAAWTSALANEHDLLHSGSYDLDIGDNNFPWRQAGINPATLLDCKNVTIYGLGSASNFKTSSVGGADVFQVNGCKNLHFRNLAITATVSGSVSGSNGISLTGGFDNITGDNLYFYNLPSLDKTSYIDGGKAITVQSDAAIAGVGSARFTNIYAKGCAQGVGVEPGLVNFLDETCTLEFDNILAEDCYTGFSFGAPEAASAIAAGTQLAVRVRGQAINCQKAVAMSRTHGIQIDVQTTGRKTAAARRLNPSGVTWFAADTIVEALAALGVKHGQIRVTGNNGACDYKARIGGISQLSSGLNAASENCDFYLDIGGTAGTADLLAVSSGGFTLMNSRLWVSTTTASSMPADFLTPSNANDLSIGGGLTGTVVLTSTGHSGTVQATARWSRVDDVITLDIPGLTGTSNATTFNLTGLPAALVPTNGQGFSVAARDNGAAFVSSRLVINNAGSGGTVEIYNGHTTAVFTNSGTKALQACTLVYRLR